MKFQKFGLLAIIVAIVLSSGCGKNVPLKRNVRFSDDDSPLTRGTVFFETETFQAHGQIQNDGTFVVGSEHPGNGLPPGIHRVGIIGAVEGEGLDAGYSLIDPKLTSPYTSGIVLEVDASTRRYDIKVDRNPNPKPLSEPKRKNRNRSRGFVYSAIIIGAINLGIV